MVTGLIYSLYKRYEIKYDKIGKNNIMPKEIESKDEMKS